MKYLKPKQEYIDLYDRLVVERCRRLEQQREIHVSQFLLYFEIGEAYINKEKTILKWMDTDKKRDELYEHAQPPNDIRRLSCRNRMKPILKDLHSEVDKPDRVLFFYECPNHCLPRRMFYSDGEERRSRRHLCPECGEALTANTERSAEKLVITDSCVNCDYLKVDEFDLSKPQEVVDKNFPKDRDRFCLSKEEGESYAEAKRGLEKLGKLMEKFQEKEKLRQEKLKKNPKGFNLEDAGYTCDICGHGIPEGDSWYDKYGVKCLICQKAIDNKEIPASLAKNRDSWYSQFDLNNHFKLKTVIIKKLVRKGILKSRTITQYGKGVYFELFLLEDNKDFLPPKDLLKSAPESSLADNKHLKKYRIIQYLKVENNSKRKQT